MILVLQLSEPTTRPATAPANTDPKLWSQMVEVNRRGSAIQHLTADFEQKKFTPLLKRPMVSTGKIVVAGTAMRWDTVKPEPTSLLINEKEAQLFYPQQKIVEIYPIDQRLGSLAASPLPRLEVLQKYFSFAEIPVSEMDKQVSAERHLALRLTPIEDSLKEHIEQVRVLLDVEHGYIVRAEMLDADGDRTVIAFSNVQASSEPAGQLQLELPAGVKVSRPLEALDGQAKSK